MAITNGSGIYNAMGSLVQNPLTAGIIGAVGGASVGAVAGYAVGAKNRSSKKRNSAHRKTRKRKSGRYTPRTAGKGRDRSTKRIRYTKKGQPYVILRSGKARFIKKNSAKRSHKMKGGRY